MKKALVLLVFTVLTLLYAHAQTSGETQAQLQALEQTEPVVATDVPRIGIFYSAKLANQGLFIAILPGNLGLPAWNLGGGLWLVDDLETSTALSHSVDHRASTDGAGGPPIPGDGGSGGDYEVPSYTNVISWNTNELWLELTNVANGMANLNLYRGTNSVYGIYASPDIALPFAEWTPVTELWPTNTTTNTLPFSIEANFYPNQFVRAMDWTDYMVNGLYAWWSFDWFGNLNVNATDWDGTRHQTLGDDFTNQVDPNIVSFGLVAPNNYVTNLAPVQVDLYGGTPSWQSLAVDDTNGAVWQPYGGTNLTVDLGAMEGWHTVWLGLKGFAPNAMTTWQHKRMKLDMTPPLICLTNSLGNTVNVPVIQLQGYSPEALSEISYDLTNANGLVTQQPIQVTDEAYSTNTWEYTTTTFQGFDVRLTNGLNTITIHATDLAGNMTTTNYDFIVDYGGKTNPPQTQVYWPLNGQKICGSSFICHGWVADPTVTISAQLMDTNQTTNMFMARVGRDGQFWLEHLPLNGGTNWLTLTVIDVVSNMFTTNLTILTGDAGLNVDQPSAGQTPVTGEMNTTNATIWVNGVQATDNGNNTWTAQITPISANGGAVEAMAIPNTDNGGNGSGGTDAAGNPTSSQGQSVQSAVAPPQGVYVSSSHSTVYEFFLGTQFAQYTSSWSDEGGGTLEGHAYNGLHISGTTISWPASPWPGPMAYGVLTYTDDIPSTAHSMRPASQGYVYGHIDGAEADPLTGSIFSQTADGEMKFAPGGASGSTGQRLWQFNGSAVVHHRPFPPDDDEVPWAVWRVEETVADKRISIGNFGPQDELGNAFGLVSGGSRADVTVKVKGADAYKSSFPGFTEVTLASLTVVSNATQIDTTNWACVKATTNDYVYVKVGLSTDDTNALKYLQVTGGEQVDYDPFQWKVSKSSSQKVQVTATLGSTSLSLNIWVIWATVEIKTSGSNPPNAPSFIGIADETEALGISYYNGDSAAGKVCIIATITPAGIHKVISGGWSIYQNIMAHEFVDGAKFPIWYFDEWRSDFTSAYAVETHTLDENDKIYAIDAPNIGPWGTDSYDKYNNFSDWVEYGAETCSSTDNFWHFRSRWKLGQVPPITLGDVGPGTVSLPTSAFYPAP